MMYYISKKVIAEFNRNLNDWFLGGPKDNGWTRTGPEIIKQEACLVGYSYTSVSVEEGLAKNRAEAERWHLSFLNGDPQNYLKEYLLPRYDKNTAHNKMALFFSLCEDIKQHGIKEPIWVAEMPWLGFDLFRFNGCHRLCVAKFLGIKQVPAIVFKAELLTPISQL